MKKPSTLAHRLLNLTQSTLFTDRLSTSIQLEQIQFLLDRPYSCRYCGFPISIPWEDQEKPKTEFCEEH